jgi:hypothetical protein
MARWNPFTSTIILRRWHDKIRTTANGCALWGGWTNGKANAHGKVRVDGKIWYVRRYVFSKYYGAVLTPRDTLSQKCEHSLCFNPLHLAANK